MGVKVMRIRQIALVTTELAPVRDALFELLGLDDAFIDDEVSQFGLENAVMTIGTTFLELVSPVQTGTTAGRLLERRGGDGGYMVIVQVDDLAAGDLFLVCSDGLSDVVRDAEIQDILSARPFAQVCGDLVQLALQRGGHDNITVITAAVADAAIQRQAA